MAVIIGGVLHNPGQKKPKRSIKPFQAGQGEFFGGNQIHLSGPNSKQSQARAFIPFQGSGQKLTTAEAVLNGLAASAAENPKYRTNGTTLPGLVKKLSDQSEDGQAPPKHLVKKALDTLEADGLLVRSGSGGGTRLKLSAAAATGLRKFKAAARAIGRVQAAAKEPKATQKKRKRGEDEEAAAPPSALCVRMAKFKAAATTVGKMKAAPAKKRRKKAAMLTARLARFDNTKKPATTKTKKR